MRIEEIIQIYKDYIWREETDCPALQGTTLKVYRKSDPYRVYIYDSITDIVIELWHDAKTGRQKEITYTHYEKISGDDFDLCTNQCLCESAAIRAEYVDWESLHDLLTKDFVNQEDIDFDDASDVVTFEIEEGFVSIMDYDNAAELFRGRSDNGLSEPEYFSRLGLNDFLVVAVFNTTRDSDKWDSGRDAVLSLAETLFKFLSDKDIPVADKVQIEPIFIYT